MMTNFINLTTLTTERFYRFQFTRQYGVTKKKRYLSNIKYLSVSLYKEI